MGKTSESEAVAIWPRARFNSRVHFYPSRICRSFLSKAF